MRYAVQDSSRTCSYCQSYKRSMHCNNGNEKTLISADFTNNEDCHGGSVIYMEFVHDTIY